MHAVVICLCTMRNPTRGAVFFLYILALLHAAESSSPLPPASPINNSIPIGSYLSISSLNGTNSTYWLSPSGIFAFGFYPSGYHQYQVGIWINKGSSSCGGGRTVIWTTADIDKDVVGSEPSILLNHEGVFMLQRPGIISKPLFSNAPPAASYALMQDSGNFVLYDSNSNIMWQSFDYPTDTIISGQEVKSGHNLLSNSYKLKICIKGHFVIKTHKEAPWKMCYRKCKPSSLNLDWTGHLYLVDQDGIVTKNLTKGSKKHAGNSTIYRAKLGFDGVFRLYRERTDSECAESVEVWHSKGSTCNALWSLQGTIIFSIMFTVFMVIAVICSSSSGDKQKNCFCLACSCAIIVILFMIATVIIYFHEK